MMKFHYLLLVIVLAGFATTFPYTLQAQTTTIVDSSGKQYVVVIPGAQYKRSAFHNFLWGKYYRDVWSTPVRVPRLNLDTTFGGLMPTERGGGKQTRHLRMKSGSGRQYSIRSIDKRYGKSLPDDLQGTFLVDIVDDQMSAALPYGGLVVKELAKAAGIYTTEPKLYFVPIHPKLDSFNNEYANQLYTLEDRPSSDNAKYYGATDVEDTEDLLEKLEEDPAIIVDQEAFVKARLFDLLVGDWDRHQDQWEWAEIKENGKVIYRPMPKDRDQAFSHYDGLLVRMATRMGNVSRMQPYGETIKNVEDYTFFYRPTDMPLSNQVTLDTWINKAKELQLQITDTVIERAVRQLPAEVYPLAGNKLAHNLRLRRNDLVKLATDFYTSLSNQVDILGSKQKEMISIAGQEDGNVLVTISLLNKDGNPGEAPYYSRLFKASETEEIHIYGRGGNDRFSATGKNTGRIRVRLIGGEEKDDYNIPSSYGGKISIYDNRENNFNSSRARLMLSNDSAVHKFDSKEYKPDEFGIVPKLGYSNEDRFYVGLGLRKTNYVFRKDPFGSQHELAALYSITQKAFSYSYNSMFIKAIGKWHLGLMAEYDEVRDQDFVGIGNNTQKLSDERHYYRYRNKEVNAALSFIRDIGKNQRFTIAGLYQMVQIIGDTGKFITAYYPLSNPKAFASESFAGGRLEYDFTKVSDKLAPRRGIRLNLSGEYMRNLESSNTFTRYNGLFGFILPLGPFTIASKLGAATLDGEPEFYQLNKLGGGRTLRGFLRYRFHGKTAVYNQNELQLNFNVKSYLFNGKMGILALYDQGRVWQPGETSDKWHAAIGGGLMLAPFNKISVTGTFAVSKEDTRLSVRIGHFLK